MSIKTILGRYVTYIRWGGARIFLIRVYTRIYVGDTWKLTPPKEMATKRTLTAKRSSFSLWRVRRWSAHSWKCHDVTAQIDRLLNQTKFFSPCWCVKTTCGTASLATCQFEPRAWLARKPCCTSREQAIANQDWEIRLQSPLSALGLGKHRASERRSRQTWSSYGVALYVSKWGADTENGVFLFLLEYLIWGSPQNATRV